MATSDSVHPRPATPRVSEVEPGIFEIDHHFRGSPGVIASYLIDGDELTLIEAGPGSTMETLLAGIRAAGFDPARVTKIIVTHIHLDHAGASGLLLRRMPRARVYVHPVGAPHLIDPSKLLASAQRIYGAMMGPLWGDFLPVPVERIVTPRDGEVVQAGGRVLRALDTPGHAVHHYAYHDASAGVVFTGDVAGIRLDRARYVRPPTPPPELDPEAWRASIVRLRALDARRLYLTHFGGVEDVAWHLDELLARLFLWTGRVGAQLEAGMDPEAVAESLRRIEEPLMLETGGAALAGRYEAAGNYRMSIDGFVRWARKRSVTGSADLVRPARRS